MRKRLQGFSLVEVVLAIGVIAFALVSVLALLPIGIKSNQVSAEETRATGMLTVLEADLRNSGTAARSNLYGLPTPYQWNAGHYEIATVSGWHTAGVANDETVAALSSRPRFQVSVIYRAADAESVDARLIVNWPGIETARPEDLTNPAKVAGYVEVFTKFRKP